MKKRIKLKYGNIFLILIILGLISYIIVSIITTKREPDNNMSKPKTTNTTSKTTAETTTTSKTTTTTTKGTTTSKKTTTTTTTKKNISSQTNKTGKTSKGYTVEYKDGAYYVGGYLIVNKTYPLDSTWKPKNTFKIVPIDGFTR